MTPKNHLMRDVVWLVEQDTDEWTDYSSMLSGDVEVRFSVPKPGNPHGPCVQIYNFRTQHVYADVELPRAKCVRCGGVVDAGVAKCDFCEGLPDVT